MELVDKMKEEIKKAVKSRNKIKKDILRFALGEIQSIQLRKGQINEDEAKKVIRKIIDKNLEMYKMLAQDNFRNENAAFRLVKENEVLSSFIPLPWTSEKLEKYIFDNATLLFEIKNAKTDSQAMGFAMQTLKKNSIPVNGKEVFAIIKNIRS